MEGLNVTLEAVTPLVCGGARPNARAEFRAASLRGVLRSWLERLLPGAADLAFGSVPREGKEKGKAMGSPVALSAVPVVHSKEFDWKPGFKAPGRQYLGYSFVLGSNKRRFIAPGTTFAVRLLPCILKKDPGVRRAWVASLWLLDRFGGMGNRSRRGYGGLQVKKWEGWKEETGGLKVTAQASSPEEWKQHLQEGWKVVRGWFPAVPNPARRILSGGEACIVGRRFGKWEEVLDWLGERYKEFRAGKDESSRAALGLPVHYRDREIKVEEGGRSASRLLFKAARLGDGGLYPVVTRIAGPWAKPDAKVVVRNTSLRDPGDGPLRDFLRHLGGQIIALS